MIRRGLISGSPADWARALSVIDRGRRVLTRREMNRLLDTVATVIDAEGEARAASIECLTGYSSLRRRRP